MSNYFEELYGISVEDKAEKKNNLTYLSWSWAWAEVKKKHPLAQYTVYENKEGLNYHTDGRTCWVKTGVTIEGLEHIEYLPIMDNRNASVLLEKVTSMDVNKAIQRSITKACARHGLALYIYAGEDLPESDESIRSAAALKKLSKDPREIELETLLKSYGRTMTTATNARTKWYPDLTLQTMSNSQFEEFKAKLKTVCDQAAKKDVSK